MVLQARTWQDLFRRCARSLNDFQPQIINFASTWNSYGMLMVRWILSARSLSSSFSSFYNFCFALYVVILICTAFKRIFGFLSLSKYFSLLFSLFFQKATLLHPTICRCEEGERESMCVCQGGAGKKRMLKKWKCMWRLGLNWIEYNSDSNTSSFIRYVILCDFFFFLQFVCMYRIISLYILQHISRRACIFFFIFRMLIVKEWKIIVTTTATT